MTIYGYAEDDWKNARRETKRILAQCAKDGHPISYSELASQIKSARFDPASQAFAALLGDLSTREYRKGRGMLSVLVVHKGGDLKPGKGFFELAKSLGVVGDEEEVWVDQFNFVTSFWKKN